ncbi:uncharacterized protein N7473_008204 [Penicillium subrubescens]|uniref:uncharacterized protein n=1 Tax=Penicillium subrubescens TaxID=1316194 RepID=UPI0025450C4E|nr:uncharacterized protein N7473_008204 [Penicillium subrubescens]KAJ5891976.1 hypothetical protein N7473_008204 [Penicillium subrubescens]
MAGVRSFFENEWIFPASHGPGKSGTPPTLAAELSLYWEEGGARLHCPFSKSQKYSCPPCCTATRLGCWRLQDDLDGVVVGGGCGCQVRDQKPPWPLVLLVVDER